MRKTDIKAMIKDMLLDVGTKNTNITRATIRNRFIELI